MVEASTQTSGRITVKEYDITHVLDAYPMWAEFSKERQLAKLREMEPAKVQSTSNTTCVQGHRWAVDGLDASQPTTPPIRLLAVGRGSSSPSESDLSLEDEVDRVDVTGFDDNDDSLVVTSILGSQEGNVDTGAGETLSEVGLYAGAINGETAYFLNHSRLATPIDKDSSITATITVTLTYSAV